MIKNKKWFAFFSHTGSEIVNLYKRLGVAPDCITTNKSPGDKDIDKGIFDLPSRVQYMNNKPRRADYDSLLNECMNNCICTLHGWMRIVPETICKDYEIYNLHPGLITKYPELKGKDPQDRVQDHHDKIGVVIHKVIPEVDSGEVLVEVSQTNPCSNIHSTLKSTALEAWIALFEKKLLAA